MASGLSPREQTEDLKAFERRMVEYVASLGPNATKWRIILVVICVSTATSGWGYAFDQRTSEVSFLESLLRHKMFTLSCVVLAVLFLCGIHKRVMSRHIMLSRVHTILKDFNMSCDEWLVSLGFTIPMFVNSWTIDTQTKKWINKIQHSIDEL